ncbi:TPA: hypothetical protein ACID6T_001749 [Pseudomonas aeruginosa]|nr:hypothetical protein [Pseudomonas sp.]
MSIIACDTPRSALDKTAWRAVCKTAAEHAQRGCGLSWGHWVTLFSSEIDTQASRLPEDQRAQALEIAAQEWDYATPAERQETQDWNAEHGYCSHGIEFGSCPAGCDRDDDDWD